MFYFFVSSCKSINIFIGIPKKLQNCYFLFISESLEASFLLLLLFILGHVFCIYKVISFTGVSPFSLLCLFFHYCVSFFLYCVSLFSIVFSFFHFWCLFFLYYGFFLYCVSFFFSIVSLFFLYCVFFSLYCLSFLEQDYYLRF